MSPKPKVYVSVSAEGLKPRQESVKYAILELLRKKKFEPLAYGEGAPHDDWSFDRARDAMSRCQGAVVLAFARRDLNPGRKKRELVASEGNHFEGGLAIAHHLPLLVLAEKGLRKRGIVSEGKWVTTMPARLDPTWLVSDQKFDEIFQRWCRQVRQRAEKVFVIASFRDTMEPVFAAIESAARKVGLLAERTKDIPGDYKITDKIVEKIKSARFLVADLTLERPNVYFELGYARGLRKTVVTIAKKGAAVHFDVRDWNIIEYTDPRQLEEQLLRSFQSELATSV